MSETLVVRSFIEEVFSADPERLDGILADVASADLTEAAAQEIEGVVEMRRGVTAKGLVLLARARDAPKHACHVKSLIMLLRAQHGGGDADGAVVTARRVIDADPANQEALKTAARIFNQRQDWDRADRFWRQLCEVAPTEMEAALQTARIAGRRNEWDTQAFFADIHLRGEADHPEALRMAVEGRMKLKRVDGLERLLPAFYRVDRERAQAVLKSLARPERAALFADVVARLRAQGEIDRRLGEFADEQARSWLELALRHEMERGDDLAGGLMRAVRTLDPKSREAEDGIVRLRREKVVEMREALKAGDAAGTLSWADRVIEIDPAMVEAWYTKGRVHLAKSPGAAAACFQHCVELAPADPWMWLNLGRALERADVLQPALEAYREVVRLVPEAGNSRRAEAAQSMINVRQKLIRSGRDAFHEDRLKDAFALYSAAATAPDPPELVATMLAAIKRKVFVAVREKFKTEDPGLVEAAEEFLVMDPDHKETLVFLGRRLMPRREHARALAVWNRLAALEPDDSHYQLQIARCCSWLRRKDEGAAAAAAALRLTPDLAEAATLLKQFTGA